VKPDAHKIHWRSRYRSDIPWGESLPRREKDDFLLGVGKSFQRSAQSRRSLVWAEGRGTCLAKFLSEPLNNHIQRALSTSALSEYVAGHAEQPEP
jgi:hypothetical protein